MASLLPSYEDILAENKELKEKLALATATLDVRLKQHQLYHERIDRLERIVFSLQEKLSIALRARALHNLARLNQ